MNNIAINIRYCHSLNKDVVKNEKLRFITFCIINFPN